MGLGFATLMARAAPQTKYWRGFGSFSKGRFRHKAGAEIHKLVTL